MSDGKVFCFVFHLVLTFTEKATLIYDAKDEEKMKKVLYLLLHSTKVNKYVSYVYQNDVSVIKEYPEYIGHFLLEFFY